MLNKFTHRQKIKHLLSLFAMAIMFLSGTNSFAQVTGIVTDAETGESLIGVNIVVDGSENIGTVTDIDGSYSIDAKEGQTLTFSYTGYELQKIVVTADNNLNVKLATASELLEEIVVIGYGSVGKKDLTGVVTKIDEKKFNKGVNSSPETLLNGKVAGLQISNNGEPGGGNRIRLRGGTSLDASSVPLIVIDGIPIDNRGVASGRNPMNFVNANDVESISVLKDASAAAIYGSRGANGVIIIKTKSGQKGKLKINYNGNASISSLGGSIPILSPNNFRNAILAKAPQEYEFLGESNTDWLEEVTENAWGTEHNLSLSGGSEKLTYMVSGGYQNINGVIKTSAHRNTSISANVTFNLLDNALKVTLNSKTGFSRDQFSPGVIGAALTFDPTRPVFDPDSQFGGYFQWSDPLAVNNPVSTIDLTDHHGSSTRTLNSISLDYAIPVVPGLSFKTNFSYDYTDGEKQNFRDPFLKDGDNFNRGGYLFNEDLRNYATLFEAFGTYKTDLIPINTSLVLTGGYSWQDFDRENRWEEGNGLEQSGGSWMYTTDIRQDSFFVHNRLISFFGRANLTHNDKYLLTLSLRRDGSSRFGESNRWGLFPAVAFGWRIMEESFAENWGDNLSNLKLRVSWGVTGNEDIADFLFTTFYAFGTDDARYQFGDRFVRTLRGKGVDPNIKWEETTSTNIGLDFGFYNNRLSGSLEVYRKYTDDLLFTIAAGGFTNLSDRILTNIGEMENRGVELELNGVVMDREDWDWNVNFNVSYNQNEIKKLDNSNDPAFQGYEAGGISGDVGQTIQVLKVGNPIESFRTYNHLTANGKPLTDNVDHNGDGLIDLLDIYEDVNADGLINEDDLVIGENAAPDFIFGLTTNARYKNFDLAATFRANVGNYAYNNVASGAGYYERLTDRVTNNIHETAFVNDFNKRQLKSHVYIEDASFLRLDNITLGYNFSPEKIFRNLRLFATVQNVFVLTGYSGLDPELPQFNGGIDNNIYPISRRFLFGVSAGF